VELFTLLFQRVDTEEPHVAVNELITGTKAELFNAIRDGEPPEFYMFWHRILHHGIEWERQAADNAQRCSLNMLVFMGHIGQFTNRNDVAVPISLALEILVFVSEIGGYLTCGFTKERSRLMSTPEATKRLGVQFDITIYGSAEDLDCSEWDTNSGII
jgi:hypothetical protein